MKNFRKVLALVLVVATLFSLTAMAGAKEYTDADKISYAEAVEVLSAIEILDGYTDDSFRPANTIKRSEAAKIIAVLNNAGDDVKSIYASACSFADAKDSWAASYIAYCAQTGIINGRNATTFDPNGKITGIEFAKMLLCTLGFDASKQGYTGSNWKINILRDAENMGLLANFAADYNVAKAITREEAANMMLNALQSNIVIGTLTGQKIDISNVLYSSKWGKEITLKDAEIWGDNWDVLYGNVVVSNVPLATIYKGLTVSYDEMDCYGNPIWTWTYENSKGVEVWSAEYAYGYDYKYTTAATLADDLKSEIDGKHAYTYEVWEDGIWAGEGTVTEANMDSVSDRLTGKGVLTLVYVDDVNHHVVITVKNTYIGEVTNVSKKNKTFQLTGRTEDFKNNDYGFEGGEIVLFWICGDEEVKHLHDAKVVEPVTVDVTRAEYNKTATDKFPTANVTGSGKVYEYAHNVNKTLTIDGTVILKDEDMGETYDLYLDEYGYIMGYELTEESKETGYVYVVEGTGAGVHTGKDTNNVDKYDYTYDVVTMDAEYKADTAVTKTLYNNMLKTTVNDAGETVFINDARDQGLLVKYEMSKGNMDLAAVAPGKAPANAVLDKEGNISWTTGTGDDKVTTNFYGTSATKYLVRTWDYAKNDYVYTAYTNKLDKSYVGFVYGEGYTEVATIQYFTETKNGQQFLTYVFVDAVYSKTSNRAFVIEYKKSVTDDKFAAVIGNYDAYDAVIGGERAVLAVTRENFICTAETLYKSSYQCIGLDDNGVPVYHEVGAVAPTSGEFKNYYFYKDMLQVKGTNETYEFDSESIVVVMTEGDDVEILDTASKINDYVEDYADVEGYVTVSGWVVSGDGYYVDELYIVVGDSEDHPQPQA